MILIDKMVKPFYVDYETKATSPAPWATSPIRGGLSLIRSFVFQDDGDGAPD